MQSAVREPRRADVKVRRYFAPDMKTALAAARREQGADVMIIGQRRVDGGLELITADEYDEEIMAAYTPPKSTFRTVVDDRDDEAPPPRRRSSDRNDAVENAPVTPANVRPVAAESKPPVVRPYVFPQVPPTQPARPAAGNRRSDAVQAAAVEQERTSAAAAVTASVKAASSGAQTSRPQPTRQPASDRREQRDQPVNDRLWTREPVIEQMHEELRSLRGLLQQQFATLAWSDMRQRHPLAAYLLRRAVGAGIAPKLARDIAQQIEGSLSFDQGWEKFLGVFAQQLKVGGNDLIERGGAAVLLGPTGVGKTTLICKLAAQFALKHGARNVALVTADSQRIAAHEQLRSFGRIMGIPVRVAAGVEELLPVLDEVYDRKLVLVDTAGMGHRDRRLEVTLSALRDTAPLLRPYLVCSAATQARDLEAILERYSVVSPAAVMLTKLDEATWLSPVLSAAILHKLPVAYVSSGQRIPEDCEPASARALVHRALTSMPAEMQAGRGEVDLMMEELFRGGDKVHARA
jgi:flagellar biosynthesis protein FlhF